MVIKPDLVKAYVLFAPVSSDARDNFYKWTIRRPEVAQKIIELYGAPWKNPEFWDNMSPVNFFENVKAPIMIHHGTIDKDVPLIWSEKTVVALKALQKSVIFHVYEKEPHEFINAWPKVMKRTLEFFKENLE